MKSQARVKARQKCSLQPAFGAILSAGLARALWDGRLPSPGANPRGDVTARTRWLPANLDYVPAA